MNIIGRQDIIDKFSQIYRSKKAEFIAVYGRRRVGKTFLVRQLYQNEWCFYHTGLSPIDTAASSTSALSLQLKSFGLSLKRFGSTITQDPTNWLDAFEQLATLLKRHRRKKRCVVFLDELPWMDTERSGFIPAFEHFWNGWASAQPNIMLITCGSATSWMEDKLINNKGGLYDRVTAEIHMAPFTLAECEDYYRYRNIVMNRYDQLQCYMVMGGIPFYMDYLQQGKSLAQNIDATLFSKNAPLREEFERLFASLFTNPEDYELVVRLLATRREGFSRKEIAQQTKLSYGGGLTKILSTLKASDLITDYTLYNGSSRDKRYRLIDSFCLFHLKFIDKKKNLSSTYWQDNLLSPKLNAWRGFSFESVCFCHLGQIKTALGIAGVHTEISPWRSKRETENHQIDLVIDRDDRIINLCELKFSTLPYTITQAYDRELLAKAQTFIEETKTRETIHLTMLTTYGLKMNEYAGHIQRALTADILFAPQR